MASGSDNSDGNNKPTGLCIHLGIAGTRNDKTGQIRVTGVAVTGAHAAAPPTPGVAHACNRTVCSGAVSDAYRDGWDRVFGGARGSAGPN